MVNRQSLESRARVLLLKRSLAVEAVLLVANREEDAQPPVEPPVVNVHPAITVQAAAQPAPVVTLSPQVVNLPEMRPTIEVNVPAQERVVDRVVNQEVSLTVGSLTIQTKSVVLQVDTLDQKVEVASPPAPDLPLETVERPKREIVFKRDSAGNIVSAREV